MMITHSISKQGEPSMLVGPGDASTHQPAKQAIYSLVSLRADGDTGPFGDSSE